MTREPFLGDADSPLFSAPKWGVEPEPEDTDLSYRARLAQFDLGPRIGKDGKERWAAKEGGKSKEKTESKSPGSSSPGPPGNQVTAPVGSPASSGAAKALEKGKIASVEDLSAHGSGRKGVNVTKVLVYEDGSKAVFKPVSGERWPEKIVPGSKFPKTIVQADGSKALREKLGYDVDQALGTNIGLPTAERTVNGETGAVQQFLTGGDTWTEVGDKSNPPASDWYRLAVLDLVIGNTDRKGTNLMVKGGRLVAIDHNAAFPRDNDDDFKWTMDPRLVAGGSDAKSRAAIVKSIDSTDWDKVLKGLGKPAVQAFKKRLKETRDAVASDSLQALLTKRKNKKS